MLNTIKRIKLIRLCVTRFLAGDPFVNSGDPSLALNKLGLPRCLGPLKDLVLSDDPNAKRMLMTLLRVSQVIPARGIVDLEPIITPPKGLRIEFVQKELLLTLEKLKWSLSISPWTECHLSTKAGPNGPALLSSIIDLNLLPESLVKAIGIIGGEQLIERMTKLLAINSEKWSQFFKMKPRGLIRKLSVISDPEAKERIIAILDYWSQSALRCIHKEEFKLLKKIPGDCTFNQNDFRRWLPTSGPYYSMDLSSATDRFPVSIQKAILSQMINPEVADAWEVLMIQEPFTFEGKQVAYATGQPMGAYSSWATFALAHHLVVRTAARLAGFPDYSNYALLGDDIVLTNSAVVNKYKQLMSDLGVDIHPGKTHVSIDTYEFAKR